MAKDPAFLFYPGDWLGGTMGMSLEEKGAYLELLIMQWNCGRIADAAAKRLVGEPLWNKLAHKFFADGGGLFNKRLELEKEKRKKHSEKQRDNANKRWEKQLSDGNATALPLENENINEDEIVIEIKERGAGKGWNSKPGKEMLEMDLDEVKAGAVKQLFKLSKNHSLTNEELKGLWYAFKIQNFTGENYYASSSKVYSHFINWSKTQIVNGKSNSTTGKNSYHSKTAGQEFFADRLKDKLSNLKP